MIRNILRWASLMATLALTSHSEWSVGMAIGLGPYASCLIPVAIDCYVMFSLLSGRDYVWALGLLWSSVVLGTVHSSNADPVAVWMGVGLGSALTVVLWRIDTLFHDEIEAKREAAEQQRQDEAREAAEVRARAEAMRVPAPTPEPAPVQPEAPKPRPKAEKRPVAKAPEKKPAPSREAARAILLNLDDFEMVSNGQLAREHGGTDTFWRHRKQDVRDELAKLSTEAARL